MKMVVHIMIGQEFLKPLMYCLWPEHRKVTEVDKSLQEENDIDQNDEDEGDEEGLVVAEVAHV